MIFYEAIATIALSEKDLPEKHVVMLDVLDVAVSPCIEVIEQDVSEPKQDLTSLKQGVSI